MGISTSTSHLIFEVIHGNLVRKIHDFTQDDEDDWTGNCDLHQHPDYDHKYFLLCKKLFFMETIDDKPIEEAEFVRLLKPEIQLLQIFKAINLETVSHFTMANICITSQVSVEDVNRDIAIFKYGGKAKLTYCPTTKTKDVEVQ